MRISEKERRSLLGLRVEAGVKAGHVARLFGDVNSQSVFQQWAIAVKLYRITAETKKRSNQQGQMVYRTRARGAHSSRDATLVCKLSQRICTSKNGPRRRWGNFASPARPSKCQWKDIFKKTGRDGCWNAEEEDQFVEPDADPVAVEGDISISINAAHDLKQPR